MKIHFEAQCREIQEPLPRSHPLWKSTTWRTCAVRPVCSLTPWRTAPLHILLCQFVLLLLFGMSGPHSNTHWPPKVGHFWLPLHVKVPWFSSECAAARCSANWQRLWWEGAASWVLLNPFECSGDGGRVDTFLFEFVFGSIYKECG